MVGPRLLSFDAYVLAISLGLPFLSCGTGGPFKVKGSLFWVAYSSLDSGSLTTAVKVELYLYTKFYCLLCGGYRDLLRNYRHTHTHTHDYRMPPGLYPITSTRLIYAAQLISWLCDYRE